MDLVGDQKFVQRLRAVCGLIAVALAALMVYASLRPVGLLPHFGAGQDKVEHALAFGALSALVSLWAPRDWVFRAVLGVCVFAILIELAQALWTINREASWLDAAIGIGAALLGAVLCVSWRDRQIDPAG